MYLLLSNDDGVQAKGLAVLAESLSTIGRVEVVAPDRNRSGASNSLTVHSPLQVRRQENGFYSIEGTPTDCVHLAITGLLAEVPDIVVAGINAGANLGDDILYSGTVAAATEGRFLGLPAIAVSLVSEVPAYYETAAFVVKKLVQQLSREPLPANTILNVNVPDVPLTALRGFEVTRLGSRHRAEPTIKTTSPRGHTIYWVGPPGAAEEAGPGTDFYAIKKNKVSITPMQVDLTDYKAFDYLADWITGLATEHQQEIKQQGARPDAS